MPDTVKCPTHGEHGRAFICAHLAGEVSGLGFNRDDPRQDDPRPDAWCDDCELIRHAHGGWTRESEKLTKAVLVCSKCYDRARIRNARTSTTLDDLASLRLKCSSCEEWHKGPILDLSYDHPHYWFETDRDQSDRRISASGSQSAPNFLNDDYCAINGSDFFVRGIIPLPIIGTLQQFCWGVWGSLSRDNFEKLVEWEDGRGNQLDSQGMFSWLSNQIEDYPDTLNLKMYAHVQERGMRPIFELEPADHPLSKEFQNGISPDQVKEITLRRVREAGQAG